MDIKGLLSKFAAFMLVMGASGAPPPPVASDPARPQPPPVAPLTSSAGLDLPDLAQVKIAAEGGDLTAQVQLADQYSRIRNYTEAIKWYTLSAESGVPYAQRRLGQIYMNDQAGGTNLIAKRTEALQWLLKAANQDDEEGQVTLATCYRDGFCVNKDMAEAYKWYTIAARKLPNVGTDYLDPLILKISSQEITEGQRRAESYRPPSTGATVLTTIPAAYSNIGLKGISRNKSQRLALINDRTFAPGEEGDVKAGGKKVHVKCYDIREQSAVVGFAGTARRYELRLP